jgi:hypothetical protein
MPAPVMAFAEDQGQDQGEDQGNKIAVGDVCGEPKPRRQAFTIMSPTRATGSAAEV